MNRFKIDIKYQENYIDVISDENNVGMRAYGVNHIFGDVIDTLNVTNQLYSYEQITGFFILMGKIPPPLTEFKNKV